MARVVDKITDCRFRHGRLAGRRLFGQKREGYDIPQFFEGELLVDAAAVSSDLPKMVEEALRRAALMPASVPKMKPVELAGWNRP
jgi:hypothetical protein